jgi:cell division septum initiation protein DivIVA
MKTFELLDELKEELSNSPKTAFSNKKAVDLEVIDEILQDLKTVVPQELKEARKQLADKEKILGDAKAQAEQIVGSAREELAKKVAEDVVTQEAQAAADELMHKAKSNAKEITMGAKEYADDIMQELEMYFADYLKLIRKNRLQLAGKRKPEKRQ